MASSEEAYKQAFKSLLADRVLDAIFGRPCPLENDELLDADRAFRGLRDFGASLPKHHRDLFHDCLGAKRDCDPLELLQRVFQQAFQVVVRRESASALDPDNGVLRFVVHGTLNREPRGCARYPEVHGNKIKLGAPAKYDKSGAPIYQITVCPACYTDARDRVKPKCPASFEFFNDDDGLPEKFEYLRDDDCTKCWVCIKGRGDGLRIERWKAEVKRRRHQAL